MGEFKNKVKKGIIWSSIERFSAQGVQFVLGIIVARILNPSDYGLVGMVAIFIAISQTFIESGFGAALIQKKDRDELDFSTTFYFNIIVAVLFYCLLFITAPLIADFYHEPLLISLTRVIGLTIIINSIAVVQRTKYNIKLDFKSQTKASLSSIFISGVIGIYLAYNGYGVWALVYQSVIRTIINTLVLWYYSKWLPKYGFSYFRFKKLFSFGSKLLISGIIDTIFRNIYLIVIGKLFSAEQLGVYTRAKQLNDFPSINITGILERVTFPMLSSIQDDEIKLLSSYRILIRLSALIVFPLMMGLASLADPLIRILLTEKWLGAIWMLQLLTIAGMWYPVHALNLSILNVKGRSDLYLRLSLIKKVLLAIMLLISIPFGIRGIILGLVISSYITLVINTHYTKMLIGYGFWKQMKDLFGVFILSVFMGLIVYFSITFIDSYTYKLIFGVFEGVIFYFSFSWIFNIGDIRSLKSIVIK